MALLLTGRGSVPARALEFADGIRGAREISVSGRTERSFRLDYRVWSESWANRETKPCEVLLLLDVSEGMGEKSSGGESRLELMKDGVREFLDGLAGTSSNSKAGLVFLGKTVSSQPPVYLDEAGEKSLLEALDGLEADAGKKPDYSAAVKEAAALAKDWGKDKPLYVVTITSGDWSGEKEDIAPLLDLGAESYTILLREKEGETGEFWREAASAPLSSHYYVCSGEASDCLERIRREIFSVLPIEVVQKLDPRFELPAEERRRLRAEGASLTLEEEGAWTVSWKADLPREKESPWEASLTVRAKEGFPGGNDIPIGREGSGVYLSLEKVWSWEAASVNVPLAFQLQDWETGLFLGEKVKAAAKDGTVETAMGVPGDSAWFGKGPVGSFSCFWETEEGAALGSLKNLGSLRPEKDSVYRLRAVYRPASSGAGSTGPASSSLEQTALYRVKLCPGTLQIRVRDSEEKVLDQNSSLIFRVKKESGPVFFCTALPEADPENGEISLAAEITGLPYGVYSVAPAGKEGLECLEEEKVCRLGVWEKDDTVSVERDRAWAVFTAAPQA